MVNTVLIKRQFNCTAAAALLLSALFAAPSVGQPPQDSSSRVQKTAFDRTTTTSAPQTVQFGRRPARIGDKVEQTISLRMRLATSLRQGNELVEKNQTTMRSGQRRTVETTEVESGRTNAVLVRYLEATKQMDSNEADKSSPPTPQPVQGNAYHCRRDTGDDGKLIVTDEKGEIPPWDQYEIVSQSMEMVGRPNPLMQFLAGRKVEVGETIELPTQLANQIFNLGDRFGEVTRFDLTLTKVHSPDGAPCAVFTANVDAASNDSSQMRMQLEGQLIVQIDTCRAVQLSLNGPIAMSETRGSYSTVYQLIGTGQMKMSIASAFNDAKR